MGLIDINKHYYKPEYGYQNEILKSYNIHLRSDDSIEIIISSKLIFIYYFKYIGIVFIFLNNKYLKYDMIILLDKQLIRF